MYYIVLGILVFQPIGLCLFLGIVKCQFGTCPRDILTFFLMGGGKYLDCVLRVVSG